MNSNPDFDCAIIGGGIGGLALAILLAQEKRKVILFEKEEYPFNKVCGEYISNESVNFIKRLGVDLSKHDLPQMNSLFMSSVSGFSVRRNLSIGGIGFSRYKLDEMLFHEAVNCGADVREQTKIQNVEFADDRFILSFGNEKIEAKTVCGAYGKNSNIDVRLDRAIRAKSEKNLFVAVKHHIRIPYDRTQVELHNFDGGYCGFSSIEDGKVNMSYITRAQNLKKCGNKIYDLERQILSKNPFLKNHIERAKYELEKPLVISHLYFGIKKAVDSHILMIGDAVGNIAPLSGNGISISLRSALLAQKSIDLFLDKKLSRTEMEEKFTTDYTKTFSSRIKYARMVHRTFGKPVLNDLSFLFLKLFPFAVDLTQAKIHGGEF